MSAIGFLHTAETHVATFRSLISELEPARQHEHLVRPDLLDRARRHGLDDEALDREIQNALRELGQRDAAIVVCTCSTIGGLAERNARDAAVPTLRVDRPMAELAVRSWSHIGVVAALETTLAPTRALLHDAALAARVRITLVDSVCSSAWTRYEQGDIDGYHREVAECVDRLAPQVDVVILAQASMAAAARLAKTDRVVLSSPRTAVQAALRAARAR